MKFFHKKESKTVHRENAIEHLSQKFNIPAADMSATFEPRKGWRGGKPEIKDIFMITVKQPIDRPNLHHDMQQELKQVFTAQYGPFNPKAMRFYFGVVEDQEYTRQQNERRLKDKEREAIEMAPENA